MQVPQRVGICIQHDQPDRLQHAAREEPTELVPVPRQVSHEICRNGSEGEHLSRLPGAAQLSCARHRRHQDQDLPVKRGKEGPGNNEL